MVNIACLHHSKVESTVCQLYKVQLPTALEGYIQLSDMIMRSTLHNYIISQKHLFWLCKMWYQLTVFAALVCRLLGRRVWVFCQLTKEIRIAWQQIVGCRNIKRPVFAHYCLFFNILIGISLNSQSKNILQCCNFYYDSLNCAIIFLKIQLHYIDRCRLYCSLMKTFTLQELWTV